jgi:2-iminobutanoate/2-iminopropanoate deaminase
MDRVLKATVFVKDINQFSRINAVYAEYFAAESAPARELVQVSELPRFVNIEISVIATV